MHSRVVAFTSQASGESTPRGLLEPKVGVLHGVLGVGRAAQHPVRQGQQPRSHAFKVNRARFRGRVHGEPV